MMSLLTNLKATRCLFSKLSLSDAVCRSAAAGTHTLSVPTSGLQSGNTRNKELCATPSTPMHISHRFRHRKLLSWPVDYLPFEWSYPAKQDRILNSGDLVDDIGPVDLSHPRDGFELSEELKTAPEEVKRVFSLEFGILRDISNVKRKEFVKLVQRHPYDTDSIEYKIAKSTFAIRCMKMMFAAKPKRKNLRKSLCETVDKRNKWLKILRRWDYKRFRFVAHQLQVTYTPRPLCRIQPKVTKKGDLRRLTREYCDKVRRERLTAYHEKLKAVHDEFVKEKEATEEWVKEEEVRWELTEDERKSTEHESVLKNIKHTMY
ncbi:small ribosomal subunit protein uS15m-like [Ornithodoros turicata]|uniref:small ribosomal subunit protein uS15m-like n=1 Tax=Ornithodoros turicata TaxID=34597 RepID=UPI003138F3A5